METTGAKFKVTTEVPKKGQVIFVSPITVVMTASVLQQVKKLPPEYFLVKRCASGVIRGFFYDNVSILSIRKNYDH